MCLRPLTKVAIPDRRADGRSMVDRDEMAAFGRAVGDQLGGQCRCSAGWSWLLDHWISGYAAIRRAVFRAGGGTAADYLKRVIAVFQQLDQLVPAAPAGWTALTGRFRVIGDRPCKSLPLSRLGTTR